MSRSDAINALRRCAAFSHIISINDEGASPPVEVVSAGVPTLVLNMRDVDNESFRYAPDAHDIEQIVQFARTLTHRDHVLVHCRLGQRRSAAAALVLLAVSMEGVPAPSIVATLRSLKDDIFPNRLMVRLTDENLGYGGKLVKAVDDMFED